MYLETTNARSSDFLVNLQTLGLESMPLIWIIPSVGSGPLWGWF